MGKLKRIATHDLILNRDLEVYLYEANDGKTYPVYLVNYPTETYLFLDITDILFHWFGEDACTVAPYKEPKNRQEFNVSVYFEDEEPEWDEVKKILENILRL